MLVIGMWHYIRFLVLRKVGIMNMNSRKALAFATVAVFLAIPGIAQAAPASPTPSASTSADGRAANYGVTVTTPAGDYSPVHLTITGLEYGESVRIKGAPEGWGAEDWYDRSATQHGNGPLKVEIEGPLGWPDNQAFVWEVYFPDGVTRTASFVYPGKNSPTKKPTPDASIPTKPTTKPVPKQQHNGGLASTGI